MPDSSATDELKKLQTEFAAHIRDPDNHAAPEGIENRRMKIYRDLFFNNISSLLSSNFPVLRALYSDHSWQSLVRDFYATHHCQTPLFPKLAREFLRYLQDERKVQPQDPAFLNELAHYEWVELALFLDQRELQDVAAMAEGDLLNDIPVLSPLAWPLTYQFPVQRIRPGFQPRSKPAKETHLLVYRNRADEVKFMQLNDVSCLLIALLQEDRCRSGLELLNTVAKMIGHADPKRLVAAGTALLEDFSNRDILLGTRPD